MLETIKVLHTVVWAFFVSCICAIWVFAWRSEFSYAMVAIGVVCIEVLVLLLNGGRCPLTAVAARYADDRGDNFDIYLPQWIARHNKLIFGSVYLTGILFTAVGWVYQSP